MSQLAVSLRGIAAAELAIATFIGVYFVHWARTRQVDVGEWSSDAGTQALLAQVVAVPAGVVGAFAASVVAHKRRLKIVGFSVGAGLGAHLFIGLFQGGNDPATILRSAPYFALPALAGALALEWLVPTRLK